MTITLIQVQESDLKTLWEMQIEAFSDLLEKYKDYERNF